MTALRDLHKQDKTREKLAAKGVQDIIVFRHYAQADAST